jgi:hypothetical protein
MAEEEKPQEEKKPVETSWKDLLLNKNVTPIIVALITAVGSFKYLTDTVNDMKKIMATRNDIDAVTTILESYKNQQNEMNKVFLRYIVTKGSADISNASTEEQAKVSQYFVFQADQKLKLAEETKVKKEETKSRTARY